MSEPVTPIGDVQIRQRANVRGRIRSVRVRPWGDNPTLEVVLADETGGLTLVFLARRHLAGVRLGTVMRAEGMVGAHQRRLAMLNPVYELETVPA